MLARPSHRPGLTVLPVLFMLSVGAAGCGGNAGSGQGGGKDSGTPTDGPAKDSASGDGATHDRATPPDAPAEGGACGPASASPGKVRCGTATCTTPAEVCCYDEATPRCVAAAGCKGSAIACDESTDCAPSGAYCCSGTSAVLPDASFQQVPVGTFCSTDPKTCLPQPGIGNSSTLACQVDSECAGTSSACIAHECTFEGFTECVHLCGAAGTTGCT